MIKIIPFFSPISSKTTQNEVLSKLSIDKDNIITPEYYLSNEHNLNLNCNPYLFVGSGGTENYIASFIKNSALRPPITLLSYDSNNSLPAAMEARKYLDVQGMKTTIIHDNLDKLSALLHELTQFVNIKTQLRKKRIGVFGVPSDWLIASDVNVHSVERFWGVKIIYIPISNLLGSDKIKNPNKSREIEDKFIERATGFNASIQAVKEAGILSGKLSQFVQEYQLDAFTIECFSILQKTDITACYALSYFNDQGIIAGCEGDIPSTFTMLIVNLLTGHIPFMANVVHINRQENSIHLAHCTVPLRIVESYSIDSHFETGKSIAIRGKFKIEETVTILKIWGKSLTDWWVCEGRIITNESNSSACRTQIKIIVDEAVDYFLERSLANHHIMVLGAHKDKIQRFFKFILKSQ